MKKIILLLALICLLPFSAVAKDIRIGVAMGYFDDNFRSLIRQTIDNRIKQETGVTVQFEDAKGDVATQIQQVENFVNQGMDAIILNLVDTQAVRPMMQQAERAGIPLVFVNLRPEVQLGKNMAYVGSDTELSGRIQMEALAKEMGGKGNLAILMGSLSSEATRYRTKGVEEIAKKFPDIRIVQKQSAMFFRKEAVDVTSNWILSGDKIDAIAANNDEMAIGAIMALQQAGRKDVLVAGIDGTPDALELIKQGRLNISVFQDAKGQGEGAVETVLKMLRGEPVEENVLIPYQLITKDNYQQFAQNTN
ncbi:MULTISPECIES: sugar ABC transporter substrate-binding protein [unclassified Brenneria]|uniref:sugar ABC transporter substrate-binding protein n=1 Tax=unclassified Brenneria TaxID=2634434 RepID=UPI001557AE12|nr:MULTISPECIES: sugar ABC transporter substrate-binding protein [unclassified Brenneria]MBJ7222782.1 sugar ABC transporter substrate-binding protein [Brenneria sp. L3-3C-1]MEE3644026.1 sugar ABC transporter substrate-binding protein [Brenneria sp. L3_3C_1]MEE3651872.1 sugar ABC transporter substrate-binding protein [Brenneria sp. HEZEL_4_2_4]NPD01832.1 sugar ABC transporter substrate-binding protein [Brenneria sp. hezel4-2-4]